MDTSALILESCPLLEAPTEVRIEIYRTLFQGAQLALEPSHAPLSSCGFKICSCKFPRDILHTCRKLRSEALPYLLQATTLQVPSTMVRVVRIPATYLSVIPRAVILDAKIFGRLPFRTELFTSLRVLELRNITVWCMYHDEAFLESEEGNESMVLLAMYNLNRISCLLTELCELSDRGFRIQLCCQFVGSSRSHQTVVSIRPGLRILSFVADEISTLLSMSIVRLYFKRLEVKQFEIAMLGRDSTDPSPSSPESFLKGSQISLILGET